MKSFPRRQAPATKPAHTARTTPLDPIPYGFIPVSPQAALRDAPLWRDGSSQEPRLSGELLLTLTALTPLIVGNHQHKENDKHSVLVPQTLDDGRVLLAASSLKGMLRNALASLLHAPMSRVTEHHYTYRPNLGFARENPKREPRAAIVKAVEGERENAKVTLDILPADASVVFVRDNARRKLPPLAPGERIQRTVEGVCLSGTRPRERLDFQAGRQTRLDHTLYTYRGGIDGKGLFASAFNERGGVYQAVLVPASDTGRPTVMEIPPNLLAAYYRTQEILADEQLGHLAPGHPLKEKLDLEKVRRAIREHARLQPNQLIYVEVEHGVAPSGEEEIRLVSLGHHFQYRWAYTSSVRSKNRLLDGHGTLRPELAPHPDEKAGHDGAPQALTGARLLFGYALDGQHPDEAALARGNYTRLAGRIAFNTAVEDPADKPMEKRFVRGGKEIQLHVLGMPRPSAVEFYLQQPALPNRLVTYGDELKDPGGELAGRKFYRHQPDARTNTSLYALTDEEKRHDPTASERGPCVRYLSAPGSRFRCTLRFDGLRPWELGALLAALEPDRLERLFGLSIHKPGYAHKLGYGKPLGLGSVRIKLDAARWHENDAWHWRDSCGTAETWHNVAEAALSAFKAKLESSFDDAAALERHLETWCKTKRWNQHGTASYPLKADRDGTLRIFTFHTDLRRRYAAARRGAKQDFSDLKKLMETE